MNKLLIPLIVIAALTALQNQPVLAEKSMEQAVTKPRTNAATKNNSNQVDDSACDGKPIISLEETFDDGSKVWEQVADLGNDKYFKHGLTITYWPDGSKRLEVEYSCGKLHGTKVAYFKTGARRSVGEYVNGKEHGTWIEWYQDGKVSKQFTMENGAWHGTLTVNYANGQKRMEVHYVKGQRQGRLITWDEVGNIIHQLDYVDNKPQPTPKP